MVAFDRLSLRHGDRALVEGGSQSGKSTLCAGSPDYPFQLSLCGQYLSRYPTAQLAIVDTKPRFRAAFRPDGVSDAKRYKNWDYGPAVPGSTRVEPYDLRGLERALRTSRVVIIQTDSVDRDAAGVTACIEYFRRTANKKHPRMVYVDETMDFYNQSGMPLRGTGNVILRCARAGAERSFTTLLGAQRVKGIPPQFWELVNKIYLFRMDMLTDMQRISESGAPVYYSQNIKRALSIPMYPPLKDSFWPPEADYVFEYWTKAARRTVWGPYSLTLRAA